MKRRYWLMKSEPNVFSIDDLRNSPGATTSWDGVRNYQARNYMRDDMRKGDLVLFYHSNCPEPGVAGIAEIVREGYPDATAWDRNSAYYDPKSSPGRPRWFMVDVKLKKAFKNIVSLAAIRSTPALKGMKLLQRGQRLSVMPVTKAEFDAIVALGTR